ncbi:hypothetical protein J27TS7_22560 [Paenibacillus dendritiformis]|uniref:prepilin-type N-terminal cleavage/methylation domain-containing protein n=1 Tax=Paenibacillus dendritiformis TaxID=130049 RepID=UPI001B28368E|nr:prepilin-type N-terminal cleavage/methylation domain-containing protein [Paenibacillus dendritiformis]GIO72742.1 hypothetical protein J27TS7_22560 [Paenibacillus dendritiformis]
MSAYRLLKRFTPRLRRRDGLTLVEVLAATVLLSLLLVLFVSLSGFVQTTDRSVSRAHEAASIAESLVHQYRAKPLSIGSGITLDGVKARSGQKHQYQAYIHPLQPYVDGAAPAARTAGHKAVVQSIVYLDEPSYENKPMLLTVTVSWEES